MIHTKKILVVALMLTSAAVLAPRQRSAHASPGLTVRPTALTQDLINQVTSGKIHDITVEFRSGDHLPVLFTAEGDLLESVDSVPSSWNVKRDFYLRIEQNHILMSLDGRTFKPFNQLITGAFTAGATAGPDNDPVANAIDVNFNVRLK